MIVALAGGVGGAKLAHGLSMAANSEALSVVVNTADDFELYGLHISPDLDTVLYTLAGLANPDTGWGVAGDTFETLHMLRRYGNDTWFALGDRDVATHIQRTQYLRSGRNLTQVTAHLAQALGVEATVLPMCDDLVATRIQTAEGELDFQEYFVRRHQRDEVQGVRFAGIERARIPEGVRVACERASLIVFCPSNPVVSIGPILSIPGMRALLHAARAPRVSVSPIVGGRALKGPADRMLASLGHEVSALGVARLYQGIVDGMVIDEVDRDLADAVAALDMRVHVTNTVMHYDADRKRLAGEVIAFGRTLVSSRGEPRLVVSNDDRSE